VRIRTASLLLAAWLFPTGVASPQETPAPGPSVPAWRVQAGNFTDAGISLGVYHRLSGRWDLGLQISSHFEDRGEEVVSWDGTGEAPPSTHVRDQHDFDGAGYLEFRRWASAGDGFSLFVGPQLSLGHGSGWLVAGYDSGSAQEYHEWNAYSVGVAPVLGADLRLLSHVSVTMALRPLRFVHRWGTTETSGWTVSNPLDPARTHETAAEDSSTEIQADLLPRIYLGVTF
jgi:hypothetical protein